MKKILIVVMAIGMAFCFVSQCQAAVTQRIILDPLSSYEVKSGTTVTIPVGATMSEDGDCSLYAEGLDGPELIVTTKTYRRSAGAIYGVGGLSVGTYNVRIVAYDNASGAQVSGTMKITVTSNSSNSTVNSPIFFTPFEVHKEIPAGQFESIAIGVTDQDPEPLVLFASGLTNTTTSKARFVSTNNLPGYRGGRLELMLSNIGHYTYNLVASDSRSTNKNSAVGQIHIEVTQ